MRLHNVLNIHLIVATYYAQVEWLPSGTAAGYFDIRHVPMYVPTVNVNLNYITILDQG
jgi:hypothetical protein